jgi:eukaryotic-like serine/threonine-protein kinase
MREFLATQALSSQHLHRNRSAGGAGDEEARELQTRLARFAIVVVAIFMPFNLASRVLGPARTGESVASLLSFCVPVVGGIVCAILFWKPLQLKTVMRIDVALLGNLGISLALTCYSGPREEAIDVGMVIAVTAILFSRSILVPSLAKRTLVIGLLTCAPLGLVILQRGAQFLTATPVTNRMMFLTSSQIWFVGLSLLTAYASKVLYGLRAQLRAASQLGPYTLERTLGHGGMGTVYLAQHVLLRRSAAIKVLHRARASRADLTRFEREVRMTSLLTHPNTITVLDYGSTVDGVFYYVMEYLDGVNCDDLVQQFGPLPAWRALHILRQVTGALVEAHASGLIHRDIKPNNIMLSARGGVPDVAHLLDFGIAQRVGFAGDSEMMGTPGYIAPETAGDTPISASADLYAIGAVGYYLLTGKQAFEGSSPVEVFSRQLMGKLTPLTHAASSPVPSALVSALMRCLAPVPEDRIASAEELEAIFDTLAKTPELLFRKQDAKNFWKDATSILNKIRQEPVEPFTDST